MHLSISYCAKSTKNQRELPHSLSLIKNLLNWIVSLYTNDGQQEVLADNYQKVSQEGHSIDNDDNTIPQGKWYVTVLNSKLKGNNSEEKNIELSRCLSLL